jgi:hypothetical protein
MRRRHRRLFNLFAFSLLGTAIYLNMFQRNDEDIMQANKSIIVRTEIKRPLHTGADAKNPPKPEHKK